MLLEKITDSVSWFFGITLAKIRTFSWLFQHPCPISGLFKTSGNPVLLSVLSAASTSGYFVSAVDTHQPLYTTTMLRLQPTIATTPLLLLHNVVGCNNISRAWFSNWLARHENCPQVKCKHIHQWKINILNFTLNLCANCFQGVVN